MPLEATSERMKRVLVLVPWVMARGEPSVEEVCARFGITREELAADIGLVMVCGLPPFSPGDYIEAFIEEGRVRIETPQALERPPRLTRDEALALLVAGRAMSRLPGIAEAPSLVGALDKLARAIAPGAEAGLADLADRIAVRLDAPGADRLEEIRPAITEHRRLRITYFSAGRGEQTERDVDPLLVVQDRGNWYLIARDVDNGEERAFRCDRIRALAPTGETFRPPSWFDPSRYANGLSIEPGPEDPTVAIEVGARASWLREVVPHERVVDLGDGAVRLELRTSRTAWLVHLMLAAAPHARALEPASLVDEVRDAARRALAAYGA